MEASSTKELIKLLLFSDPKNKRTLEGRLKSFQTIQRPRYALQSKTLNKSETNTSAEAAKLPSDGKRLRVKITRLISRCHDLYREIETQPDRLKRIDIKLDGLSRLELLQIYFRLNVEYNNVLKLLHQKKMKEKIETGLLYKRKPCFGKNLLNVARIYPLQLSNKRGKRLNECKMGKSMDSAEIRQKVIMKNRGIIEHTIKLPKIKISQRHNKEDKRNKSVLNLTRALNRNEAAQLHKSVRTNIGQAKYDTIDALGAWQSHDQESSLFLGTLDNDDLF